MEFPDFFLDSTALISMKVQIHCDWWEHSCSPHTNPTLQSFNNLLQGFLKPKEMVVIWPLAESLRISEAHTHTKGFIYLWAFPTKITFPHTDVRCFKVCIYCPQITSQSFSVKASTLIGPPGVYTASLRLLAAASLWLAFLFEQDWQETQRSPLCPRPLYKCLHYYFYDFIWKKLNVCIHKELWRAAWPLHSHLSQVQPSPPGWIGPTAGGFLLNVVW